jgi:hypothetical protein
MWKIALRNGLFDYYSTIFWITSLPITKKLRIWIKVCVTLLIFYFLLLVKAVKRQVEELKALKIYEKKKVTFE